MKISNNWRNPIIHRIQRNSFRWGATTYYVLPCAPLCSLSVGESQRARPTENRDKTTQLGERKDPSSDTLLDMLLGLLQATLLLARESSLYCPCIISHHSSPRPRQRDFLNVNSHGDAHLDAYLDAGESSHWCSNGRKAYSLDYRTHQRSKTLSVSYRVPNQSPQLSSHRDQGLLDLCSEFQFRRLSL